MYCVRCLYSEEDYESHSSESLWNMQWVESLRFVMTTLNESRKYQSWVNSIDFSLFNIVLMITKRAVLFWYLLVTFQLVFHVDLKTIYFIGTALEALLMSASMLFSQAVYFQRRWRGWGRSDGLSSFSGKQSIDFGLSQINIIMFQNVLENAL